MMASKDGCKQNAAVAIVPGQFDTSGEAAKRSNASSFHEKTKRFQFQVESCDPKPGSKSQGSRCFKAKG